MASPRRAEAVAPQRYAPWSGGSRDRPGAGSDKDSPLPPHGAAATPDTDRTCEHGRLRVGRVPVRLELLRGVWGDGVAGWRCRARRAMPSCPVEMLSLCVCGWRGGVLAIVRLCGRRVCAVTIDRV